MNWISTTVHAMVYLEPWLDVLALMALLKAGLSRRFPAMTTYLALRTFTEGFLYFILEERHFLPVSVRTQTLTYIYSYWILYALGAVAIFFVLQEIFKAVMEPVPGLQRLGLIAFRWVSVVSVVLVVAMNTLPLEQSQRGDVYLAAISSQLMRCVATMEICLLAFLALSVHSLGRSFRGRVFGIGLGFGLEAAGDLIMSLMSTKPGPIWSLANLFLMSASVITLVAWTVYFVLPEPAEERGPITLPVTSPLLRWNDIASALGQRPAHVALGTQSSSFFLQDVEQVVDKFLTKTS
ncbi:MAG TPA: hypothetical protein VMU92_11450 [Acidobacteriaceae bacterium]|nr:hypothetical protein [Acidobacteriaceae bacterium]